MRVTLRNILITFLVSCFLIFMGYYIWRTTSLYTHGPTITLSSPEDHLITENPRITVTGKVTNVSTVYINDRPIFITPEGDFSEEVTLARGYTILEVRATDRFGRETYAHRSLRWDSPSLDSISLTNIPSYGQKEQKEEKEGR